MGQEKRGHLRTHWQRPGTISSLAGTVVADCVVKDISAGGARLIVTTPDVVPDYFRLDYGSDNTRPKCRVRWRRGKELGVQFFR